MKKAVVLLFMIICFTTIVSAFDIEENSKQKWNKIEVMFEEYLQKIISANTLEEVERIDELYNIKINTILTSRIPLKYYQYTNVKNSYLEFTKLEIYRIELMKGKLLVCIEGKIVLKRALYIESIIGMQSYIHYKEKDIEYTIEEMVLKDENNVFLYSERFNIKPINIKVNETGNIRYFNDNPVDIDIIRKAKIITLK